MSSNTLELSWCLSVGVMLDVRTYCQTHFTIRYLLSAPIAFIGIASDADQVDAEAIAIAVR